MFDPNASLLTENKKRQEDFDLQMLGMSGESGECKQHQVHGAHSGRAVDSANGASTSSACSGHESNLNGAQTSAANAAIDGTINQNSSDCQRPVYRCSKRLKDALANTMNICAKKPASNGGTYSPGGSGNASPKSSSYTGQGGTATVFPGTVSTGGSGTRGSNTGGKAGQRKKRTARDKQAANQRMDSFPPDLFDPDETLYCLCQRRSFGKMILCDNDLCPMAWFHFSCVSLVAKPKGHWYCPKCRAHRPSVVKPMAQLLEQLERFNKEMEDKYNTN